MNPVTPLKAAALTAGAAVLAVLLVACSGDNGRQATSDPHSESAPAATGHHLTQEVDAATSFRAEVRKLWEDHVAWTRFAIVSISADLPDATATTEKLLRNQTEIGDAVKPFYGAAAGDQLTALLNDHILIAAGLVTAAKTGDSVAVEARQAEWYKNAESIGLFLSAANPTNWDAGETKAMMREHLDLTLQEAVHYLQGDHQASVADYDEIRAQILGMSDMLSEGIIAQFPEKFSVAGATR